MKNFIIGFVIGVVVTTCSFIAYINYRENPKTGIVAKEQLIITAKDKSAKIAPPKAYPKNAGDILISNYTSLSSANQPVDCNSFTIDPEGFKEIVNDARFNGFRIYFGKETGSTKSSVKLLFCGIAKDYTKYYYNTGGNDYYLDRVEKCPDPTNPACN